MIKGAMAGRQHHTGPLEVAPVGGGASTFLSFVTVPRTATVETAGLAVVAVVTATIGPGGTATARAEVASAGAGEVGPGSVLVVLGADAGTGGAS